MYFRPVVYTKFFNFKRTFKIAKRTSKGFFYELFFKNDIITYTPRRLSRKINYDVINI
jgi:hypothetical protein